MKFSTLATAASLTLALLATPLAAKAQLPTIFSTGVDAFGSPLAVGSSDSHYQSLTTGLAAQVLLDQQAPSPYAQSPTSRWVWEDSNGAGDGIRSFQTTFFLTSVQASSGLLLTGNFAADNMASVYLNGNPTAIGSTTNGNHGFIAFAPFAASSGFVAGTNTLEFRVSNDSFSIGGLNVDRVRLTASAPEPGTLALLAFGVAGGIAVRRRKAQVSK